MEIQLFSQSISHLKKEGCWGVKESKALFHTPTFPRIIEMNPKHIVNYSSFGLHSE